MATKFKNGIEVTNGSLSLPYALITGPTTLDDSYYTVECNGDKQLTAVSATTTTATITTTTNHNLSTGAIVGISNFTGGIFLNGTYIVTGTPTTTSFTFSSPTNAYTFSYTNQTGIVHIPFTITLPSAVGKAGRLYNIKNTGTAFVTLSGSSFSTTATTGSSGAGQTVLNVASTTGITVGSDVSGTGIAYRSMVTNVNGNNITINQATTSAWVSGGSVIFTQDIDGDTTHVIESGFHTVTVQSTGSKWILL